MSHLLGYLLTALKTERRNAQKKVESSIPYSGGCRFFAFLPDRLPPADGRGVVRGYSPPSGRNGKFMEIWLFKNLEF
jgi:hypothetical protein